MKLPDLATPNRPCGNAYYCSIREFPTGDLDVTAIKLGPDDQLKKGRGGVRKNTDKSQMDDATLIASRRRAARNVRTKAMCMQANNMLTLTFRENMTDLDEGWRVFRRFSRLMRWRFGDSWVYVVAAEFQERGAVHFHLAICGYFYQGTVRRLWLRAAGSYGGNIDFKSSRTIAGKRSWNPRRIGQYLAKYLTKTDISGFNRKRYATGGKIPEPEKTSFWLGVGLPMHSVLVDIIKNNTTLRCESLVDLDGFYPTIYASTS